MADWDDSDTGRPAAPVWAKLVALGVIIVVGWIALSFVFAIVGRAVALLGYVLVAVIAYFIGKTVGRSSGPV